MCGRGQGGAVREDSLPPLLGGPQGPRGVLSGVSVMFQQVKKGLHTNTRTFAKQNKNPRRQIEHAQKNHTIVLQFKRVVVPIAFHACTTARRHCGNVSGASGQWWGWEAWDICLICLIGCFCQILIGLLQWFFFSFVFLKAC